jgi:ferredoxin-like protein FixX
MINEGRAFHKAVEILSENGCPNDAYGWEPKKVNTKVCNCKECGRMRNKTFWSNDCWIEYINEKVD